ncbi:hypothetical protein D3C78_1208590 [compost metagenome]
MPGMLMVAGMAGEVGMHVLGMFDHGGLGVALRLGAELVQAVLAAEVEVLPLVHCMEGALRADGHAAHRVAQRRCGGLGVGVRVMIRRGGGHALNLQCHPAS